MLQFSVFKKATRKRDRSAVYAILKKGLLNHDGARRSRFTSRLEEVYFTLNKVLKLLIVKEELC